MNGGVAGPTPIPTKPGTMTNPFRSLTTLLCAIPLAALMLAAPGCSASSGDQATEPAANDHSSPDSPPPVSPDRVDPIPEEKPEDTPPPPPNPLREGGKTKPDPEEAWGKGKHSGIPFDPIKENGPIFVDWPKPKLAIMITGQQMGYLEPCGCAGLDRMKGGLSRRHSLVRQLREQKGWTVIGLDVGGLSKGAGLQAELKFQITADAMRKMGYDVVGIGTAELRMPTTNLVSEASPVNDRPGLLVSSNVGLFGFDAGFTGQPRIIEAAGMKIGVISIFGKSYQKLIHNDELEMADPQAVLAKQVPELKDKCDLLVLLAHASMEESTALGKEFPDFDLVVTSGGAPEPPASPALIEGAEESCLIEVGEKGMNAIVLGLYDDLDTPLRYQRVPLDARFPASKVMRQLMAAYQEQLKDLGLAGLGIRPVSHPTEETNGGFVGSHKCESCHEESYKIWKKSGHAKAWETLVEAEPPRNFDPECISCHVVGWNPQKYFPYQSGYISEEKTPKLVDVGCESCHGPGQQHVAAEMDGDEATREKSRLAVRLTMEEAKKRACLECHDLDNSPDFDFDTYWPQVEHWEED